MKTLLSLLFSCGAIAQPLPYAQGYLLGSYQLAPDTWQSAVSVTANQTAIYLGNAAVTVFTPVQAKLCIRVLVSNQIVPLSSACQTAHGGYARITTAPIIGLVGTGSPAVVQVSISSPQLHGDATAWITGADSGQDAATYIVLTKVADLNLN